MAALMMVALPVAATLAAVLVPLPAVAQTASSIQVEGNRRVEVETIRSYFKPGPGGRLDQGHIDDGLKALIETGLFQDVKINQAGGRLIVTVVENPVIGKIAFEGNKKVRTTNSRRKFSPSRAARCPAPWSSPMPSASLKSIATPVATT
jgi:outer membrane protein insertion porin family